ncbi:hypothetical protein [Vibrio sp. JPW-9-11-11]|nr:hypothetical protein [Vibrio sp. JPW-9-11-11]
MTTKFILNSRDLLVDVVDCNAMNLLLMLYDQLGVQKACGRSIAGLIGFG